MYGTSLPVGGPGTHAVLAAHTGYRIATLFDRLSELVPGDIFFIDVEGETLPYVVDDLRIVEADDVQAVSQVEGADYVTLLTCRRTAETNRRLLVRGVRVAEAAATGPVDPAISPAPGVDSSPPDPPESTEVWLPARIGGAAAAFGLAGLLLAGWLIGDFRRSRQ